MIPVNTSSPFIGFVESRQGGRPENQDSCGYADTALGLLVVVCDGMGGGPGGKLASSIAVTAIIDTVRDADSSMKPKEVLEMAVNNANVALLAKIKSNQSLRGMGTTAAVLLINDYSAVTAHVGDSRIYLMRKGRKVFRTFDHSLVAEMVKRKSMTEEQARLSSDSNIITRALGVAETVEADFNEVPYLKGDRFMICTDGIWGPLNEAELMKIASKTKSPAGATDSLALKVDELGFANGGKHDNLTLVLIETTANSILEETMSTKNKIIMAALAALCILSLAGNVYLISGRETVKDRKGYIDNAQLDSIINARIMAEYEKMLSKNEEIINELYKKINDKEIEDAKKLLENNIEKQNVIKKLDNIINKLDSLKFMNEGKEKSKNVDSTLKSLKDLNPELKKYGIKESDLVCNNKNKDNVMVLLTHNIAKEGPNGKSVGHYNAVINVLNSVRYKLCNQ